VRIRCDRTIRGAEPVRDYIAGLPTRERDDWDETLALLGELGLEAPYRCVSWREKCGRFGLESTESRTSSSVGLS